MATQNQSDESAKPVVTKDSVVTTKKPISPLWWIFGTLLVVLLMIFTAGAVRRVMDRNDVSSGRFDRGGFGMMDDRDRMGRGHIMDRLNSDNLVSGVVTNIDGKTLTIAGYGTTKQVITNDSTEYYGAAQPVKVNDTVRVQGTTSGDSFTASRVMISRQSAN